jgi:osmoprotectant transport system substrate-binding protein
MRLLATLAGCALALALAACGAGEHSLSTSRVAAVTTTTTTTTTVTTTATTTTTAVPLPGAGKPAVVIGDKNFTEQFVLGQLYLQALQAEGFNVSVNRNIGATDVTVQALSTGRIALYPEYLDTWVAAVAGYHRPFRSAGAAYQAGQRYALAHGFELLDPTPFSDTEAIAVTVGYANANQLGTIGDLRKIARLTLGGPAQFEQGPTALAPAIEQAYGVTPTGFTPLAIGGQYAALDQGSIQAAAVNTTDGQLAIGDYALLKDPFNVFGWGNVVPVVSDQAIAQEGPAFADTINRVSALLTTNAIRQLNMLVDVAGENPNAVAKQFLEDHGLLTPAAPTTSG